MANGDNSPQLMEYRVQLLEKAVGNISGSLTGIERNLQTLATLEVHHADTRESLARAFSAIDGLTGRVRKVEDTLPILKLTSGWIRAGMMCLVGLILVAVAKLVILH